MPRTVNALQGDMLDLIVWRETGKTLGRVAAVLDDYLHNYDLPDQPEILAAGTPVYLQDFVDPIVVPTIKLWN